MLWPTIGLVLLLGLGVVDLPAQENQSSNASAAGKFTDQQLEFFEAKVRPVLAEHCFDCHGPDASPVEGGLSLASRKAILAGGDSGAAIVVGKPESSLLIKSIHYDDIYEMPPDGKMSDENIAILSDWVKQGAPWPADEDNEIVTREKFDVQALKQEHWAWQPIKNPTLPQVKDGSWEHDPIDRFILKRLEEEGIQPAAQASREHLIRRAYFDVIGLPPTPAQVKAFVDDKSDNAFEKVVDQLLASPHFGERWTRHWMDLVRYAETYGHEFDYPIPYPHQYRDYLIRAFNEDVPYNQLIQEHLAGDLLPSPRRNPKLDFNESKLGTGFWFFGEAKHGAVDSRGEEAVTIDNQIDVMSKTFLGLTVACARCHDHKFDAISTADYYALAGFLQSSRRERMMLDPGRKIEAARSKAKSLYPATDEWEQALDNMFGDLDRDRIEQYLTAATEAAVDRLPAHNAQTIQGESLKQAEVGNGTVEVQRIAANGGFKWQDDQQYWWRDGKVGDAWVLEFEVPEGADPNANATEFHLQAGFTIARDYGAARISIDDQLVAKRVDFYSPDLSTKTIDLGRQVLTPGKHSLKFKLLKPNRKAIPRNMIGVDYLSLIPKSNNSSASGNSWAENADKQGLDAQVIERVAQEIASQEALETTHPFFLLRILANAKQDGQAFDDAVVSKTVETLTREQQRLQKFLDGSDLFQGFDGELPRGWASTGTAFEGGQSKAPRLSAAGDLIQAPGTISSGAFGKEFQGVLRSPPFELKHDRIHYRFKGSGVTVRLIVNGFYMDEYNALLFNGCKQDLPASEQFTWHTQAGDVKNHKGNMAHLEIIDRGNGYIELDQIRFSNDVLPPEQTVWGQSIDEVAQAKSERQWLQATAGMLVGSLHQLSQKEIKESPAWSSELASWILKKDLVGLLERRSNSKVGQLEADKDHQFVSAATNSSRKTIARWADWLRESRRGVAVAAAKAPAPMMALGMTDGVGENEHVFIRGNHKNLGPVVERRFLSAISEKPIAPEDGSGRLQLARKITAPNNPLSSRVAVNRIWHHLFGRGIVETVDNFGVLGKRPTHPELLDHLATRFQRANWSVKGMIKSIMLSKTYQMASTDAPETADVVKAVDPDNRLLHRANIKRLQGEAIRDAMLAVSGRLDDQMYGPSVPIHLTPFMDGRGRPSKSGPLDGDGRRSLYIAVRRNFLSPMMLAFDTPIPFNAIGRRNQSNVPAQALILMNSPLVEQLAGQWAEKLIASSDSVDTRIEQLYQQAFSRSPTQQELAQAKAFLESQAEAREIEGSQIGSNQELWKDLCHVIFNVKEFIYIQ